MIWIWRKSWVSNSLVIKSWISEFPNSSFQPLNIKYIVKAGVIKANVCSYIVWTKLGELKTSWKGIFSSSPSVDQTMIFSQQLDFPYETGKEKCSLKIYKLKCDIYRTHPALLIFLDLSSTESCFINSTSITDHLLNLGTTLEAKGTVLNKTDTWLTELTWWYRKGK